MPRDENQQTYKDYFELGKKVLQPNWHILDDGKIHHVLTTCDGEEYMTYIDGKLTNKKRK